MSAWSTSAIEDRHALGGDPAREPLAEREPHALLDLLLDALGRARDQLVRLGVVQQDRDRVDLERLLDADEQLVQELLEAELGERRIAQTAEDAKLVGGREERRGRR